METVCSTAHDNLLCQSLVGAMLGVWFMALRGYTYILVFRVHTQSSHEGNIPLYKLCLVLGQSIVLRMPTSPHAYPTPIISPAQAGGMPGLEI